MLNPAPLRQWEFQWEQDQAFSQEVGCVLTIFTRGWMGRELSPLAMEVAVVTMQPVPLIRKEEGRNVVD